MYKEDDISEIYIDLHKIYSYANNTLCTKKEMNNEIHRVQNFTVQPLTLANEG